MVSGYLRVIGELLELIKTLSRLIIGDCSEGREKLDSNYSENTIQLFNTHESENGNHYSSFLVKIGFCVLKIRVPLDDN